MKIYVCPVCEASFTAKAVVKGKIPNHRWLLERCPGSGAQTDQAVMVAD